MKHKFYILISVFIAFKSIFGQCGSGTPAIDRYCNKQSVVYQVSPATNEKYRWYYKDTLTSAYVDYGYASTYMSPYKYPYKDGPGDKLADSLLMLIPVQYQKEISMTNTPALPSTFNTSNPANVSSISMTLNSTANYVLNKITVLIFSNYFDQNQTTTFTVNFDDNIASTTNYSKSITVNNSVIKAGQVGSTNLYAVELNLGFDIQAASGQTITVASTPLSLVNFGSSSTDLNSTYTLTSGTQSVTLNYGTNKPGIFNYDITLKCPKVTLEAQYEFDYKKCCFEGAPLGLGISSSAGYTFANSSGGTTVLLPTPISTTLRSVGISDTSYFEWYYNSTIKTSGKATYQTSATSLGTYTLKAASKATFINDPNCFSTSTITIDEKLLKIIKPSDTVCVGNTITLTAQNAGINTSWLPTSNFKNIKASTATFSPSAVQNYTITVKSTVVKNNQITNGTFANSAGTIGQGTAYTVSTNMSSDGKVGIVTGNTDLSNTQLAKCQDRTSGTYTDNFLAVNSANSSTGNEFDRHVWSQTVNITAGQAYTLTSYIANLNKKADPASPTTGNYEDIYDASFKLPNVKYYINYGSGYVAITPTAIASNGAVCQWKEVSQNWTAPVTGTATIRIVETSTGYAAGNEFAIDDISFGVLSEQQDTTKLFAKNCLKLNAMGICGDTMATLYSNIENGFIDKWRNISSTQTSTIYTPIEDSTKVRVRNGEYTYEVTAYVPAANQIVNGDFESGNTGFTTSYSFGTTSLGPGGYIITKKVTDVVSNKQYYAPIVDHTYGDGTGNMMVIDQQETAGTLAWQQSVNVVAGTSYDFQMYFANIMSPFYTTAAVPKDTCYSGAKDQTKWSSPLIDTCTRKARMELILDPDAIAGTTVKTLATTKAYDDNWYLFRATYTATKNATIKIQFVDLLPKNTVYSSGGTDFAIDDITFTPRTNITLKDTVTIVCTTPLSFINFSGSIQNKQTNLEWTIAKPMAGSYYIESSKNGKEFSQIAMMGADSYTIQYNYSFEATSSNSYYRIKFIDQEGIVSYSKTINLQSIQNEEILIVPNPVEKNNYVSVTSTLKDNELDLNTEIYNLEGKLLESSTIKLINGKSSIDIRNLEKGIYLIHIKGEEFSKVQKLIIE
ncbi:MAG: T9SS type A sorting domain-containing protein [Cytophagales bacterium]